MDNFRGDDEESQFFDAREHIFQESDFPSIGNWEYDVWVNSPQSVGERRSNFIRYMGLGPDEFGGESSLNTCEDSKSGFSIDDVQRIMRNSGAVLRSPSILDEFSSSRSSVSSWNTEDFDLSHGMDLSVENGSLGQFSSSVQQSVQSENGVHENTPRIVKKLKNRFLSKLRSMSCMMSTSVKDENVGLTRFGQVQGKRAHKIRVRHYQRKLKELSALFSGQDIQAHEGSIMTMKFSLDGKYLASAGEDKIVRVWQVVEDQRSDTTDIPEADPSCVYFSMNHSSEVGPLMVEKTVNKSRNLRRTQDSACVILPPNVFRISEKPLHVFQGHSGEILDLSWSKDNCLLSSSVDKTVRLWRVGVDQCIKIFRHSDYVTCVQFNPLNEDFFITGSIDGKVRIWSISGCQVVDWTETRDIITAVSYRPDAQGGIIGSITGTCRFFDLSDNHFQLGNQMCLSSKKKSSCRRITCFQFLPQDPTKVLVTCADSKVRVIDGTNVIEKYKGLRNAGNQISASFTSDGKHIVSASDDSNVYVWNFTDERDFSFSQPKATKSFECFSSDASVAIPWSGFKKTGNLDDDFQKPHKNSNNPLPFTSSSSFLGQEYFFDSNSKGSATWPEEKLPISNPQFVTSPISKAQYKLFRTCCQSSSNSHAWGMVIVTAGWDGRIRSFLNYGLPVPL